MHVDGKRTSHPQSAAERQESLPTTAFHSK